ncbi:hypothetical protein CHS0354_002609, partial [Potamilus streckersoni]
MNWRPWRFGNIHGIHHITRGATDEDDASTFYNDHEKRSWWYPWSVPGFQVVLCSACVWALLPFPHRNPGPCTFL